MRFAAFAVLALACDLASAADLTNPQQTQDVCAIAANKFVSGDMDGAFNALVPYWPLPKEEIEALAYQSKTQMGMVSGRFGQPLAAEYVRTETAGPSLVKHIFLLKHTKHALRMSCVFYKPAGSWLVNSVVWDDKPQELFK